MRKLLILWSLPDSKEDYDKYKTIIKVWNRYMDKIYSPIDTKEFKWDNKKRFERAVNMVEESYLIIWEMSLPSTWQWLELWIAYKLEKSVIIIAKIWSQVSWLIKWNPFIKKIVYYEDLDNLRIKLEQVFKNFTI